MNKESTVFAKNPDGTPTGAMGPRTTSVVPRYVKTVEDATITDINKQQLKTVPAVAAPP